MTAAPKTDPFETRIATALRRVQMAMKQPGGHIYAPIAIRLQNELAQYRAAMGL